MIPFHFSLILAVGVSVAVFASGCRRKRAVVLETPPPPTEAPAAAPATPPPSAAPVPVQTATAREPGDAAATYTREVTQTLNDFLGDYIREKKRIPRNVNEMVSLKIITSIPPVPGGKQWVIDQRTGKVSAR